MALFHASTLSEPQRERERLLFVGCILALALTYFIAAQRLPGGKFLAALVLLSSSPPLEQ